MPKACCNCPCNSKGGCMITGEFISAEEMIWRRGKECPFVNVLAEDDVFRRWIPVSERLPKADEHDARGYAVPYLVMNGWMRVTARRTKDYWVLFGNGTVLQYVTHWMPLPEPPEGES